MNDFNINLYIDETAGSHDQINLSSPITYYYYFCTLTNIFQDQNISCKGNANVKFNVGDIVQNETINFEINIKLPKNLVEQRYNQGITLIWIEVFLVFIQIAIIGFIVKIIITYNRESRITEKDRKRDEEFWDFIGKKVEEQDQ